MRPKTGKRFIGFNPAISSDALKKISGHVRSWRLHRHTEISETDLRPLGQPEGARVDELLRRVLPIGAVSTPGAHQYLPDALAPTTTNHQVKWRAIAKAQVSAAPAHNYDV